MSKFIFILFLLFSSLNSFSQNILFDKKIKKSNILTKLIEDKKEEAEVYNEEEIDLLLNNNLCEILSIKPSDLLSESMLKKLKANV